MIHTFSSNLSENQTMKSTKYELLEQQIDSFPVLPSTVVRVMEVTGNPESSAKELMQVILPDQSLCLTILKIANSVLFGRPKKVDSLKLAVTTLGFNEVQSIALSKAFINAFAKLSKQHKPAVDSFWQHSFLCGMAARVIARDLNLPQDTAFMAGLLHDIGKLIMLQTFAEDYAPDLWMGRISDRNRLDDEQQQFSFTHDVVGGELLRKWFFPDTLIAAVANHHHPEEAVTEKTFALIVQLADMLASYCSVRETQAVDDIVAAVHTFLPEVRLQWQEQGLAWKHDAVEAWFNWLQENREQSSSLMDIYSNQDRLPEKPA